MRKSSRKAEEMNNLSHTSLTFSEGICVHQCIFLNTLGGGGDKHFSESKENFKVVGLTEWLY